MKILQQHISSSGELNPSYKKDVQAGRFYHFKRVFIVETPRSSNQKRSEYSVVSLNFFERIAVYFLNFFKLNFLDIVKHKEIGKGARIFDVDKLPKAEKKTSEKFKEILKSDKDNTNDKTDKINISTPTIFSQKIETAKISFANFKLELEQEIFPFYEKHEGGFDYFRIHGRMHVARAVIFGEVMARYYQNKGQFIDFDYVRRTIGLHDAGRKGNGIDLWEKESSDLLCNYLISKNTPKEEAVQKSNIIVKEKADKNSIAFKIFQSADCLDIMRPCTGNGGRSGFNPKYLTFLQNSANLEESQFRQSLIEEAWFFIQVTEQQKMTSFNESKGFMDKLFEVIKTHQAKLPILSSILLE